MELHTIVHEGKLKCTITDTGNRLSTDEIADFSLKIDKGHLFKYRVAVGKKTREMLRQLKPSNIKRKMNPLSLKHIMDEGNSFHKRSGNMDCGFLRQKKCGRPALDAISTTSDHAP